MCWYYSLQTGFALTKGFDLLRIISFFPLFFLKQSRKDSLCYIVVELICWTVPFASALSTRCIFAAQQNVSIQQKSFIRKTVAIGQTTSIRTILWVVKMLLLAFSVPLVCLPPPLSQSAVADGETSVSISSWISWRICIPCFRSCWCVNVCLCGGERWHDRKVTCRAILF